MAKSSTPHFGNARLNISFSTVFWPPSVILSFIAFAFVSSCFFLLPLTTLALAAGTQCPCSQFWCLAPWLLGGTTAGKVRLRPGSPTMEHAQSLGGSETREFRLLCRSFVRWHVLGLVGTSEHCELNADRIFGDLRYQHLTNHY